jgi:hypothetical protein
VDTGVFVVVVDAVVDIELPLTVELLLEIELLTKDEVKLAVANELRVLLLLLLVSSLNSVRPLGPPHISVLLPLHGMLQRPSVAGKEFAFNVSPQ